MPVLTPVLRPILSPVLRNPLSASTGSGFDPSADALFARMTIQPAPARKTLYNNMIVSLKASGVWAKLDCLYITAAADAQAANLNIKSASYNLTPVNSPTFTADSGYAGDGTTSYLDTGYNPATAGANLTLNNAMFGVWANADSIGSNSACELGSSNGTQEISINARLTSNRMGMRINNSVLAVTVNNNAPLQGFLTASRLTSTDIKIYKNGGITFIETFANASVSVPGFTFFMCAKNISNVAGGFSVRPLSAAIIGGGLTDAEMLALYNAIAAYRTGVGL